MVAKITGKLNTKATLTSDKTGISTKQTTTDATKLSGSLSGNISSFGSLTNSTLSKSLEKSSSSKNVDKTAEKTSPASTEKTEAKDDSSIFAELDGVSDNMNEVSSTMKVLQSNNIPAANYAKTSFGNAQMNIELANNYAAVGNWEGVISCMNTAQQQLQEAQYYAQKAGDTRLQQEIGLKQQVCNGSINSAKSRLSYNSMMSTTSTGTSAGVQSPSPWVNAVQTGLGNGSKQATENTVDHIVGDITGRGTNKAGNSENTDSTSGSSNSGKTSSVSKTKSTKTSGLEYDKNNKQIKTAVEKEAVPTYNEGSEQIKEAKNQLPQAQGDLSEATKDISGINYAISNLNGKTEDIMEQYSADKEKLAEKNNEISQKQSIIDAQRPISENCQNQITEKTSEKTKAEGELNTLKTVDLANAKQELTTANNMPAETEEQLAAKNKAIIQAEEKVRVAEEKIRQKEAEIKQLESDIADLKNTKEEADSKIKDANDGLTDLKAESEKISKEVNKQGKIIEEAGGKAAELKKDLDSAYDKKTKAEESINKANAQIDAGKMKQELGENLRDNAIKKVKQENGDGSTWYNPLSWFS